MARKRKSAGAAATIEATPPGDRTPTAHRPFPFEFDTDGPTDQSTADVLTCWNCERALPGEDPVMSCPYCGALRKYDLRFGPAPRPCELPDIAGVATTGTNGGGKQRPHFTAEDDAGQFLDELADSNDGDNGPGRFNLGRVTAGEWADIIESSKRAVEDLLLELKRHSDSATIVEEQEYGPIRILEQEIGRLAMLDLKQARQLTATKLKLAAAVERLEKLRGGVV